MRTVYEIEQFIKKTGYQITAQYRGKKFYCELRKVGADTLYSSGEELAVAIEYLLDKLRERDLIEAQKEWEEEKITEKM